MRSSFQRFLPYLFLLGLLLWGGYVVFYYLGYEAHLVVLVPDEVWKSAIQNITSPFSRGVQMLGPFFSYLFSRLKPFTAYAVISVLLYLSYVGYTIFRSGKLFIEARISALHILLLSLGSLWLLTTTLFFAEVPGLKPGLLLEPLPEVYSNVGPEAVSALGENFQQLLDVGCLQETGQVTNVGARIFRYTGWCMQKAFVTRMLSQVGMLLLLVINFLVLGRLLLWLLRLRPTDHLLEFLMSLGLGAACLTMLLWFLALVGQLRTPFAWGLLLLIPVALYRYTQYWLMTALTRKWTFRSSFHAVSLLLFWLLVSYLAFNFFTVTRPFPIGWDDLGKYINAPRQMSTFGRIIPGMLAVQWEYLTSLGFLLFGYSSTFGATFAQQINWLAGLLAVFAVFACTRFLLGERAGLLAALFYYTLPMVGHFSFADMKTENALFFYGVVGIIGILAFLRSKTFSSDAEPSSSSKEGGGMRWLFVAGILFAAGFATKPTLVLLFFMGGVILTFALLGNASGIGAALLSFAILTKFGGLSVTSILEKVRGGPTPGADTTAFWILSVLGLLLLCAPLILSFRKKALGSSRARFLGYCTAVCVLLAGFLAFSSPWMVRNMVANSQVSPSAALSAPNAITPWIRYSPENLVDAPPYSRALPEELQLDPNHAMCKGTAKTEELDRYWGYGTGWQHYLELPWRAVMNKDSQGYYLGTSPLLLIFPLVLLLPFFWSHRLLRFLFYGTIFYAIQWIFVANGIPWYGIGMFLGFAIFAEMLVRGAPNRPSRIVAGVIVAVAIAMNISLRMWQFDMQRNLYEYAWGKASAAVLQEMTIPDYDDISERVLDLSRNSDRPYLYRMGTFISYFIPRNLEVITQNDNQLGFFNCLNQEGDHQLTLRRLQALGFHSIVFDTNTATIERDPNGTLHQKVRRFMEFANNSALGITSVVNNPGNGIAYMLLPPPEENAEVPEEAL